MIEKLLHNLAEKLDSAGVDYMVIGGQAVLVYGRARLTNDIDITLGADIDKLNVIEKICSDLNLNILPGNPEEFVNSTNVLPAQSKEASVRLDFIFSFSEYEKQSLERVNKVTVDDYPVKFASKEDVIVHKMVAGRAVDIEDVKSIIAKNQGIDFDYIHERLDEFDRLDEFRGIRQRFDNLTD